MFSYLLSADAWAESLEADVYPNSEFVYEYSRGGSGSTYNYEWFCTTDSIEEIATFYEDYDGFSTDHFPTRTHYHYINQYNDNWFARQFTRIGTGWTDFPPDASLAFWLVTDESTEFERERCSENILIEIGSGYAD